MGNQFKRFVFFKKNPESSVGSQMVYDTSSGYRLLSPQTVEGDYVQRVGVNSVAAIGIMLEKFEGHFTDELEVKIEIPSDHGVMWMPFNVAKDIGELIDL